MADTFRGFKGSLPGKDRHPDARMYLGVSYVKSTEDKAAGTIFSAGARGVGSNTFIFKPGLEFGMLKYEDLIRAEGTFGQDLGPVDVDVFMLGMDFQLLIQPFDQRIFGGYVGVGGNIHYTSEDSIDMNMIGWSAKAGLHVNLGEYFAVHGGIRHQPFSMELLGSFTSNGESIKLDPPKTFYEVGLSFYF